jgi:hypothetical protein
LGYRLFGRLLSFQLLERDVKSLHFPPSPLVELLLTESPDWDERTSSLSMSVINK